MLQMHVDSDRFWELCERHHPFMFVAEKLAGFLHEGYRLRIRGRPEKKHLDVKLANLDADLRAANFAQAMRIPENLRLTGMCLVPGPVVVRDDLRAQKNLEPGESEIRAALNNADNLELLAEAEHNGWMVERMLQNWRYGRVRDDSRKVHPLLIPYSQLSELDKSYDQKTIVGTLAPPDKPELEEFGYVDVVKMVGFRVRRIRENATEQ